MISKALPISGGRPTELHRSVAVRLGVMLLVLSAAFILAAGGARADVIVIKSNAKGLRAGTLLKDDTKVSIAAGSSAVVVLPSGATRTIHGPFEGRAAQLTKGVKANPDLFAQVQRYVVTGGANERNVGAVRSMAPVALSRPTPFSWNTIPVNSSGDFCVKKGASLTLERRYAGRAETVTIIDMKTRQRVRVMFEKGVTRMAWPDELEIDPHIIYTVIPGGLPPHELRMRIIEPIPAREDTLQVLHGQRCSSQFRAFIQQLQLASN